MKPQNYCGVILLDGKYVPVKEVEGKPKKGLVPKSKKRRGKTKKGLVVLPFIDYQTHDIPVYVVAGSENMDEIEVGFQLLKDMGYPLKVLVCDESMGEIAQVAKNVFPDVIIQLCLTHYGRNIDKVFQVNGPKRRIKKLQKQLDWIGEDMAVPTRCATIEKARKLSNQIADLEHEYHYLMEAQSIFQEIFWGVKTEEELTKAENTLNELVAQIDFKTYKHGEKIKKRYLDYYDKREMIIASILHPDLDIPLTTNLIEGFNSTTLEIRLTSIRGFKWEENAKNYINALILKYRFHKFTDCKKKFKHLNGRSPLDIANPAEKKYLRSRDWISLCRKLFSRS